MTVLLVSHERYLEHDTGPRHPERPARLGAVRAGLDAAGLGEALVPVAPRPADRKELERVHDPGLLDALAELSARGGGVIDADTRTGPASWDAALLAAGAGLEAIDRLLGGEADAAFCAVRPPGHHATPAQAMGFCLANNAAVAAARLAAEGERVAVIDWDVHHGNGTQDAFYDDPRVLYASIHQWPLYPGTGRLDEIGAGDAAGTTVNVPVPPGATGDVALAALDDVIGPAVEAFGATWVIVSAGFDAHRLDPLAQLAWTSGDYADLARRVQALVPAGRLLLFLEGGYDLDALAHSAGACVAALVGEDHRPEPSSSGGPGHEAVAAARRLRAR